MLSTGIKVVGPLQIRERESRLSALEGTVQRVNYKRRELTVVAQCQVWHFQLAPDCQLWFEDQPAILLCFHPLDKVKMIYEENARTHLIKELYAWEKAAA